MKQMISRESLSDQVYNHIKRLILSGELKGGERVPEASLSKLFGVSRTPLREALKRLSDYGLVYLKPRSYAEVVRLSADEARQIAEVRVHLEELVARSFMEHAQEEDYAAIREIASEVQSLTDAGDLAGSLEQDSRLHLEMALRCGNKYLYEIIEKLDARVQLLRLNQHLDTTELQQYTKQHLILIEAMRNGDRKLVLSILNSHIMHDFHNGQNQ